LSAIALIF